MTQAFNLAQLANNLNTSGQLDATDGLSGLVANSNLASSGTASSSTFLRGDRVWSSIDVGKVRQVVQATYSTIITSSNTSSWTDTGLSATITPSSASNKVLALVIHPTWASTGSGDVYVLFQLLRASTVVINQWRAGVGGTGTTVWQTSVAAVYDTGISTTSATTYKTQYQGFSSGSRINPENSVSTMILLEMAP